MKTVFLTALLTMATCLQAQADGLQDLQAFVREVRSAQASFTQVVTSPRRAGEAVARSKTSSGRFEFLRPGRFRFEYTRPFAQTIVADGQTLWLYDEDLNQVSARMQEEALGSTPAALIASGADLQALTAYFELTALPAQDGMQWVQAQPKTRDGTLQTVRMGFKSGQLAVLDIADSLGQRSVLTFSQWQSNLPLAAERFRFQPPVGASVIRP